MRILPARPIHDEADYAGREESHSFQSLTQVFFLVFVSVLTASQFHSRVQVQF